eukprot:COSAG06_NODE_174_length_21223_cov_8.836158_12_plen_195_part_00
MNSCVWLVTVYKCIHFQYTNYANEPDLQCQAQHLKIRLGVSCGVCLPLRDSSSTCVPPVLGILRDCRHEPFPRFGCFVKVFGQGPDGRIRFCPEWKKNGCSEDKLRDKWDKLRRILPNNQDVREDQHYDDYNNFLCRLQSATSFFLWASLFSEPMSACSAALALGGGGIVRRIASPQAPALSSALGGSLARLSF